MTKIEVTDEPIESYLTAEEIIGLVDINIKQLYYKLLRAQSIEQAILLNDEITRIQRGLKEILLKYNN